MNIFDMYWDRIGWKNFEEISLYLAESIFSERRFELYGRAGEEQDGIDIISKNERGEDIICIQCKHYETIDLPTLKIIIEKFETGDYIKTAKTFIIATRASLSPRRLMNHIRAEKKRLKDQYHIRFDTWDGTYIEKELSNHYRLTASYFDVTLADKIWSGRSDIPISYSAVEGYIDRKVIPYKEDHNGSHFRWIFGSRQLADLAGLFTNNVNGPKQICLLADAYEGKTTLFEQTAYELYYHPYKLKPLWLNLKKYSHRSLIDTLDIAHSWWRSVPMKELVIIIDGLDEVDSGRFLDAVKNIYELSQRYPSLPILFSCRKLFFNHDEVQNYLENFALYELYPLQEEQVERYIPTHIPTGHKQFRKHIDNFQLHQFLYHPFYLRSLVTIFNKDRKNLPRSRALTIQYFIDKSFDVQGSRMLTGGIPLKRKKILYHSNLQRLALAMQLRGKNTLPDEEVQLFFPQDADRELLKLGSILTFTSEQWSFQNAMFQEHLAAQALKKLSFAKVEAVVCIGKQVKKVKTKWIQTLVELLSLLEERDARKDQIFEMLSRDNIELMTLCESRLLLPAERLNVLKALVSRYEDKGIRPMVVREDHIGRFFRNFAPALDMFLNVLTESSNAHLKRIVWRILQFIDAPAVLHSKILDIAAAEIKDSSDGSYVSDILYTLLHYQLGSVEFVRLLIEQEELNRQLEYRDKVYDMIVQLGLGEQFYDYGIQGISVMMHTPTGSYMRSEHALERVLLSAGSRHTLRKLFDAICSDEWVDFRHHRYSGDESFTSQLEKLCEKLFEADNLIFFEVLNFVRNQGRKYLKDEFKEIDPFFLNTGTAHVAIRYLIHVRSDETDWMMGTFVTPEAFDFLFYYLEEGYISQDFMLRLVSSVFYYGNKETMMELNQRFIEATGIEDTYKASLELQRAHDAHEKLKEQNDARYMQDQSSFEEGIKRYFEAYGKKEVPEDEVMVDYETTRLARKLCDSNVITSFIFAQLRVVKPVPLSHCLEAIANKEYFDHFRITELLNLGTINDPGKEPLRKVLKDLYDEKIPHANFTMAIKQDGNVYNFTSEEFQLSRIFEKMEFPTEPDILIDMLCMDTEGISNFRRPGFDINQKKSLSEKIISKLTPGQLERAKAVIHSRLQDGILSTSVLENHIALCGHLKIYEAKDLILSAMMDKKIQSYNTFAAAEIFIELGGEWEELLPVLEGFEQYGDSCYFSLVMKFKNQFPEIVKVSISKALQSVEVSLERKIDLAKLLMELGEEEGMNFIIEQMHTAESLPWGRNDNFKMAKIDTKLALEKLAPLVHLLFVDGEERMSRKDVKSLLLDFLFSLAEKSEDDLLIVEDFLSGIENQFHGKITDFSDLHRYRARMLENFRDANEGHSSIDSTIKILEEIKTYSDAEPVG